MGAKNPRWLSEAETLCQHFSKKRRFLSETGFLRPGLSQLNRLMPDQGRSHFTTIRTAWENVGVRARINYKGASI
jgi:hypothetical protein